MSVLVDVVNSIIDQTQIASDFLTQGIYDFVVQATSWFVQWAVVALWKAKLAALGFAWDVAQELLNSLNISTFINQAWASLDSKVVQMLTFFKVPEAVNIILGAGTTKFVFRFLGF